MNAKRLRGEISLAQMRRDQNPYPKNKAAAKKEKARRQSLLNSLEKRVAKQYSAQVFYKQERDKSYSKLATVARARQSWSAISGKGRRRVTLQRNLFGGSDARY
jgi:flagellar biosynthesis chaperone FliJ